MEIAIGIILILASIFLIVAVLMQEGKNRNLSGAIGGGSSDTFLGKSGSTSLDKKLSSLTTIVAIVFVVLVVIMYLMQDTSNFSGIADSVDTPEVVDTVDTADTTAAADASVDGTTAPAAEG
ncbi:MAG: preprotein translocase subunit SecG [Ruminococcaceae bacterium]|nr:preprotein translocase subunit SecG [Oscillospiraceae bacterium]